MIATPTSLGRRSFGRTGLRISPVGYSSNSFGPNGLPSKGRLSAADVERAFHER
jgi:hypothetical protein